MKDLAFLGLTAKRLVDLKEYIKVFLILNEGAFLGLIAERVGTQEALASGRALGPGDVAAPLRAGAGASGYRQPRLEAAGVVRPHFGDVTRDTVRMRFPEVTPYCLPEVTP